MTHKRLTFGLGVLVLGATAMGLAITHDVRLAIGGAALWLVLCIAFSVALVVEDPGEGGGP